MRYMIETTDTNNNNHTQERITEVEADITVLPGEQPLRQLTGKEREYVRHRIEHPTAPKSASVKAVYDVSPTIKDETLRKMAQKIEHRAPVLAVLTKQAERAEELLTTLMEDTAVLSKSGTKEGAQYAGVAERVINSVLDRIHGKAKQSIDVQSTSVNLNIDLTME